MKINMVNFTKNIAVCAMLWCVTHIACVDSVHKGSRQHDELKYIEQNSNSNMNVLQNKDIVPIFHPIPCISFIDEDKYVLIKRSTTSYDRNIQQSLQKNRKQPELHWDFNKEDKYNLQIQQKGTKKHLHMRGSSFLDDEKFDSYMQPLVPDNLASVLDDDNYEFCCPNCLRLLVNAISTKFGFFHKDDEE
jgi:hypothetical protein